jgi:uncharacterized membrane protein
MGENLSEPPSPPPHMKDHPSTRDALIIIMFVLVVALLSSIFEFINVDSVLMKTMSGWGDVYLAGLPWFFSWFLIVVSLILLLGIVTRLGRTSR